MRSWLAAFRRAGGRDDAREAYRGEERTIRSALDAPLLDPRVVAGSRRLLDRRAPSTVVLGSAAADPNVEIALDLAGLPGSTHALMLGAAGSGKSRMLAGICRAIVRAELAGGRLGLVLLDPKSELSELVVELAAVELEHAPPAARERFISSFTYVDPFAEGRPPVPLNVLASVPGVPPDTQAYDVATALEHLGGDGMGVRQGGFLYHAVLAGIGRCTLPALYELTGDPVRLAAFAARSEHGDVRGFFAGQRISTQSLEGVRARLHSILRVPAARRCLESETCLSFPELLGNRVTILSTGNPPLGSEDIGRVFNLLLATRLGNAIMARRNASDVPCVAVVDEFQEAVAASAHASQTFQRLLNLARSRNVSLLLATQTLATVARANPVLPEIATTNAGLLIGLRSSPADFRMFADALPVTGRRLRPAALPWDEPRPSFYTADEERRALLAEAAALPPRMAYVWDRRMFGTAILVRTTEVVAPPNAAILARELLDAGSGAADRGHGDDRCVGRLLCAPTRPCQGRFVLVRRDAPTAPGPARAPTLASLPREGEAGSGRAAEEPPRRGRRRPRRGGAERR